MSIEETIESIVKSHVCLVRFGDGEIKFINHKDLLFQKYDRTLAAYLEKILLTDEAGLLVCVPDVFSKLDRYVDRTKVLWCNHIVSYHKTYRRFCYNRNFGNAFVSRPYIIHKNKMMAKDWFNSLKGIWHNRDVVIIEGDLTRMGVGNDLFSNAHSIERIICPSANAFDKFDDILCEAFKVAKEKMILVSLGPTAKAVVYELYKQGYQAIDIGHIDSEYEWYLSGVRKKTLIRGKHTADIKDDVDIGPCSDYEYQKQIRSVVC